MIVFKQPIYLLLLFVVIPLLYLRHIAKNSGTGLPYAVCVYPLPPYNPRFILSRILRYIGLCCYWAGVVGAILILANPVISESKKVYTTEGAKIMIVLDESPSMGAIDSGDRTRFEIAKAVIQKFVSAQRTEAIGLVGFATEAAVRIPPTIDYPFFVDRLHSYGLLSLGESSSLGMGILLGVLHLKDYPDDQKILIVLTDGAQNSGRYSPSYAGEIAAAYGITVYTVGIGSKDSTPVSIIDEETGVGIRGIIADAYNPEVLQDIAEKTGGSFFVASNFSSLEQVFLSIDSANTIKAEYRIISETRSLYRECILIIFILFAIDLFIRKGVLKESFAW